MYISLISAIAGMGSLNGFIVSVLLFFRYRYNLIRLPLILYILILSIYLLEICITHHNVSNNIADIFFFNNVLYGLFIYAYARNRINNRFTLSKQDLLCIIPIIIIYTIIYTHYNNIIFKWLIEIVVDNLFIILTIRKLRSYINTQYLSSFKKSFSSLLYIVYVCFIINIFEVVLFLLSIINIVYVDTYIYLYLNILYTIMIYLIGYRELLSSKNMDKQKQVKHIMLSDEKIVYEKLLIYMRESKPYINKDIRISDIAEQLGEKQMFISYILNNKLGMNFNNFINKYRIEEAIILLRKEDQKLSVDGIGLEVGFKTKSSFYGAFKKITGKTPINY